jgi:hypothetical protein
MDTVDWVGTESHTGLRVKAKGYLFKDLTPKCTIGRWGGRASGVDDRVSSGQPDGFVRRRVPEATICLPEVLLSTESA